MSMDKILHFLLAFMIALAVGGIAENSAFGLVAGLVVGAGKEILDSFAGGTVELLDFAVCYGWQEFWNGYDGNWFELDAYGTEGDGLEFRVFDWNSKEMMEVRPWTK